MGAPPKLFISTGEESGDLHAANLCKELRAREPGVQLFGLGGRHMRDEGVEILYPLPDLALIGFVEVVKKLPKIMHVKNLTLRAWDERKPDAVVLLDYPGFHLRLAKLAHERGIPVFYYIAPQVWAWKEGRVARMRETLRRLMVIFPFEERYFRQHGVDAVYVGHPLTERIEPPAAGSEDRPLPETPTVGLLPGSRANELRYMLPPMIEAARRLRARMARARFLLPLAKALPDSALDRFRLPEWIEVCRDNGYARRREMDYAWTSSGTATVENALLGIPMAVVYRTGRVNMFIGRRLVRVPYIGMVNLVAQKGICPEFIQEQCHPEQLARHAFELLSDFDRLREMRRDLRAIRERIGPRRASSAAAAAILEGLGRA